MKMTDKELAKRLADLCDAFRNMCSGMCHHCEKCEMKAFADEAVCCHAYVLKKMAEVQKRKCESCKHFHQFSVYGIIGCDKHEKLDPNEVCEDYERKAVEE